MDDRNVILANFQACTGIDDFQRCMAILEEHGWDLQNAVHTTMNFSSSEPASSAPKHQTQNKEIKFNIHYGNQYKSINFDENGMIGTLLQIIAVECNLNNSDGDSLKLTGWPTGDQPSNDLPLSVLDFPSTVNLTTISNPAIASSNIASQSSSRSNPFAAFSSQTRNTTSSSHPKDDDKFKHFKLKIFDKENNERHELKYPGVKQVGAIKDDVYALTLIPAERQIWSGWPSDANDDLCLYQININGLELELTVDDNRPRQIQSVNLNNARLDPDSDAESSEEDIDYPDEDDFPDFLESEPAPKPRSTKVALVTDTSGDFQIGTMQFLQEFQSRFGDRTPIWYIGTIEEAAKEAYGSQSKAAERKMLAVYIHNERSIQSNIFCTQILCAASINEFLQANCITWGFDITNLNNKQILFSQIDRIFGGRVAQSLRRMNDDEFPIMIMSYGRGTSHEISEMIRGECDVSQVMTKLVVAKDQSDVRKSEDQKAEMVREERENEISNQESEYEKSLKADREKMRLEAEQTRKNREEEEKKKYDEMLIEQHKVEMENILPPEPPKTEKEVSQLRFRFPDGRMVIRRFLQTEKLNVLFIFIGSEGFSESSNKLIRPRPRLDLSSLDRAGTLKSLGLIQDSLVVEPNAESDDDDDSEDDSMEE